MKPLIVLTLLAIVVGGESPLFNVIRSRAGCAAVWPSRSAPRWIHCSGTFLPAFEWPHLAVAIFCGWNAPPRLIPWIYIAGRSSWVSLSRRARYSLRASNSKIICG
jgi:hypothetical protein